VEQHPIDEIIAPFIYANNMNTVLFNTYLQIILLPLLAVGTVIIMDNARYQVGCCSTPFKRNEETHRRKGVQIDIFSTSWGVAPPFTRGQSQREEKIKISYI
jgi:hypothetical protein